MLNPPACPAYDDLIWYADTGSADRLAGHDPGGCAVCGKYLREYDEMRGALGELRGLEDYAAGPCAAEDENAPRPGAITDAVASLADDAGRVLELVADARTHCLTELPRAKLIAEKAWQLASQLSIPENRTARIRGRLAQAEAQSMLGACLSRSNQLAEGISLLTAAIERWEELGEPVGLGGAQTHLAYAFSMQGDLDQAEQMARAAIATLAAIQQEFALAKARHALATILMDRQNFAAAKREIQEAIPVFRRLERRSELAMALQMEGWLAMETGDAFATAAAARLAATLFAGLGHRLDEARCQWLLGRAQIAGAGGLAEGLLNLELARRRFTADGLWIEAAMILCAAGRALLQGGDRAAARTRLVELEKLLPADQANAWVVEAVRTLHDRMAAGDLDSLTAEFGRLTEGLIRLNATPDEKADAAN